MKETFRNERSTPALRSLSVMCHKGTFDGVKIPHCLFRGAKPCTENPETGNWEGMPRGPWWQFHTVT